MFYICGQVINPKKEKKMKKLFIVLIAIVSAISVNAQENVKKEKDLTAVVDSLSAKLDKLQNDYNFLWCKYELTQLSNELNQLNTDLSLRVNDLKIDVYHSKFNYEWYSALKKLYNRYVDKYHVLKDNSSKIKMNIGLIILTSNFSDLQIDYLNSSKNVIDSSLTSVESALNLFQLYIEEYKKKW